MNQPLVNYATEICAWCQGAGVTGTAQDDCIACHALGSVLVAQPARKCPHCQGTGRQAASVCRICNRTGWVHVLEQPQRR